MFNRRHSTQCASNQYRLFQGLSGMSIRYPGKWMAEHSLSLRHPLPKTESNFFLNHAIPSLLSSSLFWARQLHKQIQEFCLLLLHNHKYLIVSSGLQRQKRLPNHLDSLWKQDLLISWDLISLMNVWRREYLRGHIKMSLKGMQLVMFVLKGLSSTTHLADDGWQLLNDHGKLMYLQVNK